MTDETTPNEPDETPLGGSEEIPGSPDETSPNATDETGAAPTRPTPTSAAAARRARRIGGRPAGSGTARPDEPAPATPPSDVSKRPAFSLRKAEKPAASFPPPPPGPPAEPRPGAGGPATPEWLTWAPAAVLSVGAVVMAVLIIVFSHGVWWGPDASQTPAGGAKVREQVLAAAKTCVVATNTYKYTDMDTFERKALACTTGEFRGQLKSSIDSIIRVNAPKLKASQTPQINRGGIEAVSADGRQWTILLYGQLSVTNVNDPQPRTDPFAAQVRMERAGGKWLISALTTVATPLS